ncbi:MAG: radical SAM protein [Fuerstiella sp.]|nr:radical SAM protein [Fuerstiella sp.]
MISQTASICPSIELRSLDELWFQVAGTVCNLKCEHCFISCSPHNHSFEFLSYKDVETALQESVQHGVREYYFTGGEPFLNKDLRQMLKRTLEYGPATVLTNGTVLKSAWLDELYAAEQAGRFSLEFRVSIDGPSPEINDPVRGAGTFDKAIQGVSLLCNAGFLPIITMTQTWDDSESLPILEKFRSVLKRHGCSRPRLKILPRLKIGAEENRTEGYHDTERVSPEMMHDFDRDQLLCHHSRVITSRGVFVCPILIESPDARMGKTLAGSLQSFPMQHGACYTCYQYGAICSNTTLSRPELPTKS